MKPDNLFRRGVMSLSMVLAAACSVTGSQPTVPAAQFHIITYAKDISSDWVFVSDPASGQVYVYTLPTLKLIQIIQGFTQPLGECSDNKGDVWLTDGSARTIYKLLHSGRIDGRLSDTNGYPNACAWDPKTGSLAVMDQLGVSSHSGAVLIYHHASGVPNIYYNPKQFYYNFGGFDSAGNLFFDGRTAAGAFVLSELPVNASQAKTIRVSGGKIYTPGMVQWDAATDELVVGDQNCGNQPVSCIYQIKIGNDRGTIAGQTKLRYSSGGEVCDLVQGVLWKKSVVGSDNNLCGSRSSGTYGWPYPGGGPPTSQNVRYDSQPFGTAISSAPGGGDTLVTDAMAKTVDLLYISDGNGEVTVYTYWQKTLVRQLTGFGEPMGECVDAQGDVFIADHGAKQIVEYAHAGKKPIATLNDSPYAPYACSVDSVTGALAVANEPGSSSRGNIAIYSDARGTPKFYDDKNIDDFQACAYDNDGNLLVSSGQSNTKASYFAWLPKGGRKLVDVSLRGPSQSWTWTFVNGVQWDGRFYVIDDYNSLYRVSVIGGQGYYVGQTSLGYGGSGGPFWIYNNNPKKQGTEVVGPYSGYYVDYWNYPSGSPITSVYKGIDNPAAVTVSLGTIHG